MEDAHNDWMRLVNEQAAIHLKLSGPRKTGE